MLVTFFLRHSSRFRWRSIFFGLCLSANTFQICKAQDVPLQLRTEFSEGDKLIENVANQYGNDFLETLKQLKIIEDKIYSYGIDDVSYLLAYRCFLQVRTDNTDGLKSTFDEFKKLKFLHGNNRSIYSSEAFCMAMQANKDKNYAAHELYLEKAFQYASFSNSAVLRYWISFTFASLTNSSGRFNDSIEASRIALEVALTNHDKYRESSVRAILALSEAELGYYEDALTNNQLAIDWNLAEDYQYSVLELYQNRGYMLIGKNALTEASKIFEKAIHLAVTLDAQYAIFSMHTNLAAIEQRKGNYEESNRLAGRSLKYATENNNEGLIAHANSIIAVNNIHLNQYEEAKDAFEKAQAYFEKYQLKKNLASNYGGWSDALASVGRYKEAYDAQAKFSALNQELFNSER